MEHPCGVLFLRWREKRETPLYRKTNAKIVELNTQSFLFVLDDLKLWRFANSSLKFSMKQNQRNYYTKHNNNA
jgi:hypothetical protein